MTQHKTGPYKDALHPPRLVLDTQACPECGKIAFGGRGDARSHLKRMSRDAQRRCAAPGQLQVYACPGGHGWHIGHRSSQARRVYSGAVQSHARHSENLLMLFG